MKTFILSRVISCLLYTSEDGLIHFVLNTFETKQSHYQKLLDEFYAKERYPEKETVTAARDLMNDVLSQRKDNVAPVSYTHLDVYKRQI